MKRPTEDQLGTVLALLRAGHDRDAAVAHSGMDPAAFDEWLRRPRNGGVVGRIQRALAQADLADMAVISSAANTRADAAAGTWQAAKARLEMRRAAERERELREITALALGR